MQSDPMVREEPEALAFGTEPEPTKISVVDDGPAEHRIEPGPDLSIATEEPKKPEVEAPQSWSMPEPEPQPAPTPDLSPVPDPPAETPPTETAPVEDPTMRDELIPGENTASEPEPTGETAPVGDIDQPSPPAVDNAPLPDDTAPMAHVEALHFEPRHRGGGVKWLLIGLVALLVAGYLAIDAGLIASGVKLPFHIFTQKNNPTPATTTTPPATQNTQAPVSNIPTGFKKFNLTGTDISFTAPGSWGTANSASENGYSSRSTAAKADGVYAYIVTFSGNKDVQMVVTSSKYLPPTRGAQYYDFLQWCTGTNDSKIYKSVLNFTTANGISTPSTISCDQGPLTDATKLSDNTIVQLKTKDAAGAVIGDVYTKNLTDTSLPVVRIRDAAMTNSDNIKLMLPTIKPAND
jgi:hypothetical protein